LNKQASPGIYPNINPGYPHLSDRDARLPRAAAPRPQVTLPGGADLNPWFA
jgi:hypothetical protein